VKTKTPKRGAVTCGTKRGRLYAMWGLRCLEDTQNLLPLMNDGGRVGGASFLARYRVRASTAPFAAAYAEIPGMANQASAADYGQHIAALRPVSGSFRGLRLAEKYQHNRELHLDTVEDLFSQERGYRPCSTRPIKLSFSGALWRLCRMSSLDTFVYRERNNSIEKGLVNKYVACQSCGVSTTTARSSSKMYSVRNKYRRLLQRASCR
jgi:hypothetical protein